MTNVWRKKNPKKAYSCLKKWRKANPEIFKEHLKKYRNTHKLELSEDYRKRKEGLLGPFSLKDGPDWQEKNRSRFRRLARIRTNRNRRQAVLEAFRHYGGQCFCCGEKEILFLALDHIKGGGNKHRKKIGAHPAIWAKRNGWPPIFRVACHNCNHAIHRNKGVCPHQKL